MRESLEAGSSRLSRVLRPFAPGHALRVVIRGDLLARTRRLRYSAPSFIFSKETLPIIKFPLPINALSMRKAGNNPYI